MKIRIAIASVSLFILLFSLSHIYNDIRNNRYEKLASIEVSLDNSVNSIEPNGYIHGFDFNYNSLPTLHAEVNKDTLIIDLSDYNLNKIIVGEDYYSNNTCYKETYTLNKTQDGKFELPLKSKSSLQGDQAVYYVKYHDDDEGSFVFKVDF